MNVARWGRAVYINIQKFVQFQLTVNIVALMINFVSACISGRFIDRYKLSRQKFSGANFQSFFREMNANLCKYFPGSAPLTAVQMLWVNLIMDTLGALALATEPPHEGLMKRPPIGRNVHLITRVMWRNIIGQSIYQLSVLGVIQFYGKHILKLTGPDATAILNTIVFNTFVFCQVLTFHCHNSFCFCFSKAFDFQKGKLVLLA